MDEQNTQTEMVLMYLPDKEEFTPDFCSRIRMCTRKMTEDEIMNLKVKYTYYPAKEHYDYVLKECLARGFTRVVTHDPELKGEKNLDRLEDIVSRFKKHGIKFVSV